MGEPRQVATTSAAQPHIVPPPRNSLVRLDDMSYIGFQFDNAETEDNVQ